jgi:hypothetical protein
MTKYFLIAAALVLNQTLALAQVNKQPATAAPPAPVSAPPQRAGTIDLSEYGVQFAADQRLIIVMAALDAAGFEPTPGREPNVFRAQLRKDQANLDADLRRRLARFYELNKLPGDRSPGEQAARYVSLAFALGPPPELEAPARSDDLAQGVLEVLDFAPLVREFYRASGLDARMPAYFRAYQAAGDNMRRPIADTVRAALIFLHTRPVTSITETTTVTSTATNKKKDARKIIIPREHERRFVVVPDLLGAPGAFNLRIIGDDYFLVVPLNADPRSAEVRRAYLQYLIDPLVLRFNREIAQRRADLRTLLEGVSAPPTTRPTGPAVAKGSVPTPTSGAEPEHFIEQLDPPRYDIFTAVGRSLVAATDAQLTASARQQLLTEKAAERLAKATPAERAQIIEELKTVRGSIADEQTAQLADAYERGAVLAFYFAEQLRDQEAAGFDIAGLLGDMITRFDVAREKTRPAEAAAARARATEARKRVQAAIATANAEDEQTSARRTILIKNLDEANELLRLKKYDEAETRLKGLMQEYQGEPRVFFALAQVASSAAQDTFDEELRAERLGRALANYRFAVQHVSLDIEADRALASRAHTALGRILAFLDRREEALQEFDAALQLGDVPNGAYREADAAKRKLQQPPQ